MAQSIPIRRLRRKPRIVLDIPHFFAGAPKRPAGRLGAPASFAPPCSGSYPGAKHRERSIWRPSIGSGGFSFARFHPAPKRVKSRRIPSAMA